MGMAGKYLDEGTDRTCCCPAVRPVASCHSRSLSRKLENDQMALRCLCMYSRVERKILSGRRMRMRVIGRGIGGGGNKG